MFTAKSTIYQFKEYIPDNAIVEKLVRNWYLQILQGGILHSAVI